jgi:hypothetical protein
VSKGKASKDQKGKRSKGATSDEAVPSAPTGEQPAADESTPGGESARRDLAPRLFDMPYSAAAPRMINADLGLHNFVARAGQHAGYTIELTLLDAPDHRLIRSGVLLAHRVVEGRGEWYLGAPEWEPLLPAESIQPMGQTDLPSDFVDLIRPFRRRATLGPVAGLHCERREFAIRDDRGTTMALLRDDKVTVRRGGLTTARYREVRVTPVGSGLCDEQASWLDAAMLAAGGTSVTRFPRLVTRLGAPATGLTDFPDPKPFDADSAFDVFVSQLLSTRLHQIVEADLAVRGGNRSAAAQLAEHAVRLRLELKGLSHVLDPDWVEDLYDELDWIVYDSEPAIHGSEPREPVALDRLLVRLRSERYLTLLERLVTAARAPKLGESSALPTGQVLNELLQDVVSGLATVAERLTVDGPAETWDDAWAALGRLRGVADVTTHVLNDETVKIQKRLATCHRLLADVHGHNTAAAASLAKIVEETPEEAFEAGRRFERELVDARFARAEFLVLWSKTKKKLGA